MVRANDSTDSGYEAPRIERRESVEGVLLQHKSDPAGMGS
jgi:hypothetical protein